MSKLRFDFQNEEDIKEFAEGNFFLNLDYKDFFIDLAQTEVINDGNPKTCFWFAKHVEDSNLKKLGKVVKCSKSPTWNRKFANLPRLKQKDVESYLQAAAEGEALGIDDSQFDNLSNQKAE